MGGGRGRFWYVFKGKLCKSVFGRFRPSPRGPSQERRHSIPDRGPVRGLSVGRSAEGLLSAVPHQHQQHLVQGQHLFQRLQLTLCEVCASFLETINRNEDAPLQEPSSSAHLPGLNAGPPEE